MGTLLLLIAAALLVLFFGAITEMVTYWWVYLSILGMSVALVYYDTHKRKK